jgi:chromosome segregation ATPase
MKSLTQLSVDGLKNHHGTTLNLGRLTAIEGPTGSGKSAILEAIRVGVLGHEPGLPKNLGGVRMLSSGGDIHIAMTFSDGFGFRRVFGAEEEIELFPPIAERLLAEKQDRIRKELGTFIPSFNLGVYLAKSAEKRHEYVFGLLPREWTNLDIQRFRAAVEYEEAEAVWQASFDRLWQNQVVTAESPIEGLASAIAYVHEKFLAAENDRQKQKPVSEAAHVEALRVAEELGQYDPGALARYQDVLAKMEGDLAVLEQRKRDRADIEARRSAHQRRLEVVRSRSITLTKQLEDVTVRLKELRDPARDESQAIEQRLSEARARHAEDLGEIKGRMDAEAVRVEDLRAEARQLADRLEHVKEQRESIARQLADLLPDVCPTCGGKVDTAEERRRLEGALEASEKALHFTANASAHRTQDVAEAEQALARIREEGLEAADRAAAELDVLKVRKGVIESAGSERVALAGQYDQIEDQLRFTNTELDRLEKEEIPPLEGAETDREAEIREEIAEARRAIALLQDQARRRGRLEALEAYSVTQQAELDRRTALARRLKEVLEMVRGLRAEMVEEMLAPVETTARAMLERIDPEKRFRFVYEREGRDVLDFGFEEAGQLRSYQTASSGQKAYLMVVFVAALIAAVQPAWSVLLVDDVEKVSDEYRPDLLHALGTLSDRLGNIIVAGCSRLDYGIPGWEVINVGTLESARKEVAA